MSEYQLIRTSKDKGYDAHVKAVNYILQGYLGVQILNTFIDNQTNEIITSVIVVSKIQLNENVH